VKGIVFNILEEVVTREHGERTWDSLLAEAGLEEACTSLGSYPDQDLADLVTAAAGLLNTSVDDLVRWSGRQAMPVIEHLECLKRGDDRCCLVIAFGR
jgi:Haem-NO-binding